MNPALLVPFLLSTAVNPMVLIDAYFITSPLIFGMGVWVFTKCPRAERVRARQETPRLIEENKRLKEELRQLTSA